MKAFWKGLALTGLLLSSVFSSAAVKDLSIVDAILANSSIKANLQALPSQMMQIPQMIPMDQQQGQAFMERFVAAVMSSYNEAEALNAIRTHFIAKGDEQLLQGTLAWLQSPLGRQVTQIELLGGQMDMVALQQFVQGFSPESIGAERYQLLQQFVTESNVAQKSFEMAKEMVPMMMEKLSQSSAFEDKLPQTDMATMKQQMSQQMDLMMEQMGPVMEQQMIAAMAFQLKELNNQELAEYAKFISSPSGQHYLMLSLEAGMSFAMGWMGDLMPTIIAEVEAAKAG